MSQLSGPSPSSLSTSVMLMLSRPTHWRARGSDSSMGRLWLNDVLQADLQPMREQLSHLSNALEGAICLRRQGASRVAVEEQAQALRRVAQQHQAFLDTLGADWRSLREFVSYRHLVGHFHGAVQTWQQAVLLNDGQESACFRQCEQLGWTLLGEAAIVMDMFVQGMNFCDAEDDLLPYGVEESPSLVRGLLQRCHQWFSGAFR
ncbi:MAG: hypothetical protein RR718_00980 [Comamonas sp.]